MTTRCELIEVEGSITTQRVNGDCLACLKFNKKKSSPSNARDVRTHKYTHARQRTVFHVFAMEFSRKNLNEKKMSAKFPSFPISTIRNRFFHSNRKAIIDIAREMRCCEHLHTTIIIFLYDFQHSNTQLQLNLFVFLFPLFLACEGRKIKENSFRCCSSDFPFFRLANLLIHCQVYNFIRRWRKMRWKNEIESWTKFSWYWTWFRKWKLHELFIL